MALRRFLRRSMRTPRCSRCLSYMEAFPELGNEAFKDRRKRNGPRQPTKLESIPRGLFRILSHHDASNIRPRLPGVFHFLCVFASGNLRGVLGGKAASPLVESVAGGANFVEEAQGGAPFGFAMGTRPLTLLPPFSHLLVSQTDQV
jgi:hypothetical protein